MPWPNRLEDGAYDFGGRHHQLPIDEVSAHNAIHGLVRWQPWTVAEQHRARVVMQHALHPQPGYSFCLTLTIEYELGPEGLSVHTEAVNVGAEACPFGSGAHPYLRLGEGLIDDLMLSLPASSYLRASTRGLPVAKEHVEGWPFDFRQPRAIGRRRMDHAFCDLERDGDGRARVRLADPRSGRGVTLWLDESFQYVMLFTGDGLPDVARRSLAVEPMTCAPNAFRTGDGLVVLAPGESLSSVWGISLE
jgi:aldose 1-epimerase